MNKREKNDLAGAITLLFLAAYGAFSLVGDILNIIIGVLF